MTIVIEDINSWQANVPAEWALRRAIDFEARNANAIKALQKPRTGTMLGINTITKGMDEKEVKQVLEDAEDIWKAILTIDMTHTFGKVNKNNEPVIRIGHIGDIWMDALSISDCLKKYNLPKNIVVNGRKVTLNYSALWIIIRTYKIQQYKEMYLDETNEELVAEYNKLVQEAIISKEEKESQANELAEALIKIKQERGTQ